MNTNEFGSQAIIIETLSGVDCIIIFNITIVWGGFELHGTCNIIKSQQWLRVKVAPQEQQENDDNRFIEAI